MAPPLRGTRGRLGAFRRGLGHGYTNPWHPEEARTPDGGPDSGTSRAYHAGASVGKFVRQNLPVLLLILAGVIAGLFLLVSPDGAACPLGEVSP